MRKAIFLFSILAILFSQNSFAKNGPAAEAQGLFDAGQYKAAADLLVPYVRGEGANDQKALVLFGKSLDKMTTEINNAAEIKCYRSAGAPRTPKCMEQYAATLNAKYGEGSYRYDQGVIAIKYTGAQYTAANSAEADYLELTKNLLGVPDDVIGRINNFLAKYPSGEWHKKGLLLLARINADIWWIHKKWSWLLYNGQITDEELIIRGEKYRKDAIATFKKISGGEEGAEAKKELKLIEKNEDDGKIYGIINESNLK